MSNRKKVDSKIIHFRSRSRKLALDIMRILRLKKDIVKAFNDGTVLKTNCLSPTHIFQEELLEDEEELMSDLSENGLMVYHVLYSPSLVGKVPEFEEDDVIINSFEDVVLVKSFLCVPEDIFKEAKSELTEEDVVTENDRKYIINNFIEDVTFRAKQGQLFAYIVNETANTADFGHIEVTVIDGNLVWVD